MKVAVNCKCDDKLFELNETQCKVIKNYVKADVFDEDMKRRLRWVLMHVYEQSFKELKSHWEPKLKKAGVEAIPLDPDKFAQLVFAQPDYKDRAQREQEASVKI